MSEVKVNIGSTYKVVKQISINQRIMVEGTELYAWFQGQLYMVDKAKDEWHGASPKRIINAIKAGKLVELK